MDKGQVKTYDSIQKLLNETSHLKQAISPAERLKIFPRRNSSMRTPQSKLSSVTQTLQEEAEDNIQDTRLWASQTGLQTDASPSCFLKVSKWYIILDDLPSEHIWRLLWKRFVFFLNVTGGTQYPLIRPGIMEHCKKYNATFVIHLFFLWSYQMYSFLISLWTFNLLNYSETTCAAKWDHMNHVNGKTITLFSHFLGLSWN